MNFDCMNWVTSISAMILDFLDIFSHKKVYELYIFNWYVLTYVKLIMVDMIEEEDRNRISI